jgi:membrane associated rhomboid family serine protease
MNDGSEVWVSVAAAIDERRAAELALVLTARGVAHRSVQAATGWELWVLQRDAALAAAELMQYRLENARPIGQRRLEEVGDGWPGVVAYLAALLGTFVALRESWFGLDWLGAGRLDAGRVLAGEWWRTVTALTVHVDFDHVGGNAAFGAFFGYFVSRYLGRGVGWLTILAAAAAANALNAFLQAPTHRSIGASTAVFAALGVLTAYTWRRGYLRETPWRARIAPIIAGLGLLAFTGTAGENTDLSAHLLGFVVGFAAGATLAHAAPIGWLKAPRVQAGCAALAACVLLLAWSAALIAAG